MDNENWVVGLLPVVYELPSHCKESGVKCPREVECWYDILVKGLYQSLYENICIQKIKCKNVVILVDLMS